MSTLTERILGKQPSQEAPVAPDEPLDLTTKHEVPAPSGEDLKRAIVNSLQDRLAEMPGTPDKLLGVTAPPDTPAQKLADRPMREVLANIDPIKPAPPPVPARPKAPGVQPPADYTRARHLRQTIGLYDAAVLRIDEPDLAVTTRRNFYYETWRTMGILIHLSDMEPSDKVKACIAAERVILGKMAAIEGKLER